jgi:hypothetical protein
VRAFVVGAVGLTATASFLLALAVRALFRRNRVDPRVRTNAPLGWLWSYRQAARLHRRLCRLSASARLSLTAGAASRPPWPALTDLGHELSRRACEIDGQLVVANRAPAAMRLRLLRDLAADVGEAEAVTERLVRTTRAWRSSDLAAPSLAELRRRLDALDEALGEIVRLETAAGLSPSVPPA